MNKAFNRFIDISGWVLLAIFAVVLVLAVIKTQDPVLLILGLFFFATGVAAKAENTKFGQAIEEFDEHGRKTIKQLDKMIDDEKKRRKYRA